MCHRAATVIRERAHCRKPKVRLTVQVSFLAASAQREIGWGAAWPPPSDPSTEDTGTFSPGTKC